MNSRKMRPVGITFLAITFLYIGCLGTIIFPIIVFAGRATEMWHFFAVKVIYSESLLRITSYFFFSIWFLLYVAYAVIGVGLWKLRSWARSAVLVLLEFFAIIGILALIIFVRPWAFTLAMIVGMALPCAWMVWYLKRPRVCFAFEAWPPGKDGSSTSEPPLGLSKMGKAWVVAAVAASFGLFLVCVTGAGEGMISSSPIYGITLQQAQDSPCVVKILGTPLIPKWGSQGNWTEGSTTGTADIVIPVNGPKGKGRLAVKAEKKSGVWKINSLILVHESKWMQIEPSIPNSTCQ